MNCRLGLVPQQCQWMPQLLRCCVWPCYAYLYVFIYVIINCQTLGTTLNALLLRCFFFRCSKSCEGNIPLCQGQGEFGAMVFHSVRHQNMECLVLTSKAFMVCTPGLATCYPRGLKDQSKQELKGSLPPFPFGHPGLSSRPDFWTNSTHQQTSKPNC